MNLDLNDIEILMDAVSAWESKDGMHQVINTVLTSALIPKELRAEFEAKETEKKVEREQTAKLKRDQAVLLKAKLIGIKDSLIADNALEVT